MKVKIITAIHPREYGRFAATLIRREYKNDPLVKFERFPYKKTVDAKVLALLKKDPQIMERPISERWRLYNELRNKQTRHRRYLNLGAAERGFVPVEIHNWNAPAPDQPVILYSKTCKKLASKLVNHLIQKGYKIDERFQKYYPREIPGIAIELPGYLKSTPISRKLSEFSSILPGLGAKSTHKQTLDQLRFSKRFLRDTIEFLKAQ